jgi:integrase
MFEEIIAGWVKERKIGIKVKSDMERVVRYLCECAETTDPNRITTAHMRAFKDWLVDEEYSLGYIKQQRSQLTTLWRFGIANGGLTNTPLNGFQYFASKGDGRRGYTDAEARLILTKARQQADPLLRWSPWILAATGARIGEVVGSKASTVRQINGVWCLDFQDGRGERPSTRMPGERLKNAGSNRREPLAQFLLDEGFLEYWRSIPNDGALFPGVKPSFDGKRSHYAIKKLGKWIRKGLGLIDPRLGPDHSWRHRFKTVCRDAEIDRDVHDALTGHTDGSASGEYGEFPLAPLIVAVAKIQSPLAAGGDFSLVGAC